jgi:hypothetical protein
MHDDIAVRDKFQRHAPLLPDTRSKNGRRPADYFVKERTKGTETLKADLNFRDAQIALSEHFFRLFDSFAGQIFVRRLVKFSPEETNKVIAREMRTHGDLGDVKRTGSGGQ